MHKFQVKKCSYHFISASAPGTQSAFKLAISQKSGKRIKSHLLVSQLINTLRSRNVVMSPMAFTLINITEIMSGQSFGFAANPTGVLKMGADLSLTFALNPDSDLEYGDAPPVYLRRSSNDITFWGYSHPKEYMTLTLDISKVLNHGVTQKDMEYLYNVLGAAAKNYSMFSGARGSSAMTSSDVGHKYSAYYRLSVPEMLYSAPYSDLVYCKQAWELCPELISPDHIDAYSALYYAAFLSDRTVAIRMLSNAEQVKHLVDALYPFYSRSQAIIGSSKYGEDPKLKGDEEMTVALVYPTAVYKIFQAMLVPGYVRLQFYDHASDLIPLLEERVQAKLYTDISWLTDLSMLYEVSNFAKDAIYCRSAHFGKAAAILTDNVQNNGRYF